MYEYQEPSLFSGKRGLVFIIVVIFHIGLGYALVNGLARRIVQTIIPPVEIAQIEKPKVDDKPPPPPPKIEQIKPFVPPPEIVDIQQAPAETTAITQVASTNTPAPVAPPPPKQVARTPVKQDPRHPLKIGEEWYPDASKRAGEEGRCIVKIHIMATGQITDAQLQQTSGFPRLDEACLKAVKGQRMIAPTEDGKPIEADAVLPIQWKLRAGG